MRVKPTVHLHFNRRREWRYVFARWTWRGVIYTVAVFLAAVSLMPFIWSISTSLKQGHDVLSIPPKLIPNPIFWQNYRTLFTDFGGSLPFGRWVVNTVLLTGVNIFGEILFAAIAGFGFARFRFPGRNVMFVTMLATAIVPGMVQLLPQYKMFFQWGWTGTYLPLIVPRWFGGMFLVFLFRQYFVTIPRSLDESATIDGASYLDVFFRIMLPLTKPMLATAAILVYMSNWNSFFAPFIYLQKMEQYTLAVGLRFISESQYDIVSKEPLLSAYALTMAAPVIVIFFMFQRYFVQGIQLSASKE
jgi:multiple sugar transport system permease protein